ncbi:MAG: ribokinase, partial [Propionibacteriaceae bacterium]
MPTPDPRGPAGSVAVVGSVNIDHVVVADSFPAPGQTLTGSSVRESMGGKGANQAVAAARAGSAVLMVARVGGDGAGDRARDSLRAHGVDVREVAGVADKPTGTALITVAAGDNTIIVVPGANGCWPDGPLPEAVAAATILLCQLEIPLAVVQQAAAGKGGQLVLNAAPAVPLPAQLLRQVDVLVVNQHELAVVAGSSSESIEPDAVTEAHERLRERGAGGVVTTLGGAGCIVTNGSGTTAVPAVPAEGVDTTGAGDAFTGVLA